MTEPEEAVTYEQLQEALEAQVRFMIYMSPFASEEWTENNYRPTEW